jgi:transcriptional regulator with XRE-family HTH domain
MLNRDRLKKLRKELRLNQSDVASKLNIRRETYTKYETGDIQPPIDQIIRLSDLFNVSTDYLLSKTDDPIPYDKRNNPTYTDLLKQPTPEEAILSDSGLSEETRFFLLTSLKMARDLEESKANKDIRAKLSAEPS